MIYVPALLENEHIENIFLPAPNQEPPLTSPAESLSPFMVYASIVISVLVIILTIFVLLKAPITIAKTGKAVTTKAAGSTLPLISKKKQLPQEKKKLLTAELIKLTKVALVLIPTIASICGFLLALPLPYEVILFVSTVLGIAALILFALQYLIARALKVSLELLV